MGVRFPFVVALVVYEKLGNVLYTFSYHRTSQRKLATELSASQLVGSVWPQTKSLDIYFPS